MNEAHASLRRLRLEHVDLYQIHGVDQVTPLDETLRALEDLVRSGKVRYIGLSNHAAWQIMKGLGISERHGWSRFESIQAYYSIAGRDLEREIVPVRSGSDPQHPGVEPARRRAAERKVHRERRRPGGSAPHHVRLPAGGSAARVSLRRSHAPDRAGAWRVGGARSARVGAAPACESPV